MSDFKQFMLQKGERVGLWAAVAIMTLLVAAGGYTTLKSENPEKVAKDLSSKARVVRERIEGWPNTSPTEIKDELKQPVESVRLSQEQFATPVDFFNRQGSLEDDKRRNPDVLWPVEFQIDVVRGPLEFHDVIEDRGKMRIGVLVPKDTAPVVNKAIKLTQREMIIQKQMEFIQMLIKARMAAMGHNPNNNLASKLGDAEGNAKLELKHVPLDEVDPKAKLARTMYPARMVIVTASFPYKQQLEVFRRSLRMTEQELLKDKDALPQFLGVQVQRRNVKAGQKDNENWEDVDVKDEVRWAKYRWLLSRSAGREPEDARMEKLIFNKLMVMPRPRLGRDEVYPPVELKTISQTLAVLDKAGNKTVNLKTSPLNRKLSGAQDPFEFGEEEARDEKQAAPPPPPPTGKDKPETAIAPDHCLMRFIDATVEAGQLYEYRLRLRLANPNFGKKERVAYPYLAEVKEIEGPWSKLAQPVEIPDELFYYSVDERSSLVYKDRTNIQVHRWLEVARLNPAQRDTDVTVADWAIADVPAYRGEYIGRSMPATQVLMWYPTREAFDLAISPTVLTMRLPRGATYPKGVPVDFSTRYLLVDFEGGKGARMPYRFENKVVKDVIDDSSMELLIMNPDGKLVVRYSHNDVKDEERVARLSHWRDQLKAAAERAANPAGNKPAGIFQPKP